MDVKDLRYFVAVYEAKGFSRASFNLGTVQSNVSARIRNLERFFGCPLFERRYRSIVATDRGDRLYPHAKMLIAALDKTEQTVKLSQAA